MTQQTYGEWMRSNPLIPNLTVTALDWYYQQTVVEGKTNYWELFEQAKQMEKDQNEEICLNVIEQILDKWEKGEEVESKKIFEQCYNETYNN